MSSKMFFCKIGKGLQPLVWTHCNLSKIVAILQMTIFQMQICVTQPQWDNHLVISPSCSLTQGLRDSLSVWCLCALFDMAPTVCALLFGKEKKLMISYVFCNLNALKGQRCIVRLSLMSSAKSWYENLSNEVYLTYIQFFFSSFHCRFDNLVQFVARIYHFL